MTIFKMKKFIFSVFAVFFTCHLFAQEQVVYQSKNLPLPDTVWVFKPKDYASLKKVPTVFLLHGFGGNYKQWHNIMDAQKYADDYGFLIVCPDGLLSSWYLNSPVKQNWQFETFFFEELFPDIKKRFKVDEQKIFITGLSMGGHGALHLFIQKPELFAAAGSTSGGVRLLDGFGKFGLMDLLGNPPQSDDKWMKYSVYNTIEKLKGNATPFIFDCGSSDFFYNSNNMLKIKCDELKLNATYISQPGTHNRAYWKKSIRQQFDFFILQTK